MQNLKDAEKDLKFMKQKADEVFETLANTTHCCGKSMKEVIDAIDKTIGEVEDHIKNGLNEKDIK